MSLSETKKGEMYIGLDVFLSGLLPVVAVLTYTKVSNINSLAMSTFIATLVCAVLVVARRRLRELKNPRVLMYGILSGICIGILFYGFYFAALSYTSPGNVAILMLFQVFTTFLFFNVMRREPFSNAYKLGSLLMVIGAGIVLSRNLTEPNAGDFLILATSLVAPVGNLFQQKARALASGETLLLLRSGIAAGAFFVFLYANGQFADIHSVEAALPYLLFNGIVIFVLAKLFWIEGIHRISVTKAIALATLGPFVTLAASFIVLHQTPTFWQLFSLVLFVPGVFLLTDQWRPFGQKSPRLA